MKNKTIIGGVIALAIIGLMAFFCISLGKSLLDKLRGTTDAPEATQPQQPNGGQPQNIPSQPVSPEQAAQIFLALGNPSNAANNISNRDNYLIVNTAYALSYNSAKGTPNWVSWRISENDFGKADRQNNFRPDTSLPAGFTRITPADYTGSGFDRGHLCPSADRSSSPEANSLTFLMTNMVPQTPDLNRNVWEKFETFSRNLVKRDNVDLYVIAGVYGEKGKLKNKIVVPTDCWKIVIAVPLGAGISTIDENSHIVAVDMPNDAGIANEDWRKFRTSVRALEQKTGYNFLSNLPQNVQDALETKVGI